MKKLIVAASALLLLSACSINYPEGSLVVTTHYINVRPWLTDDGGDWKITNSNNNFYIHATKQLSAINNAVIEDGVVLAYYIDGVDNLLPYIRAYEEVYFQVIRYDIKEGYITFIIEGNDAILPPVPDNTMKFKVIAMESH